MINSLRKFFTGHLAHMIVLALSFSTVTGQKSIDNCNLDSPEYFKTALDSVQNKFGFPGITAAFVLKDGTHVSAASGLADVESGKLMTKDSRMLAASIGKSFVAATAIALSKEGLLNLDEPISCWLSDEKWFSRLPNHNKITLRHLLTHGSGLPDHVYMKSFSKAVSEKWKSDNNPFQPVELVEFILNQEPLFEAGKDWSYSDTGYIIIGLIIEKATRNCIFDEINQRFLQSLDLHQTSPSDQRLLSGLIPGYMSVDNRFQFPSKTLKDNGEMAWHPGFEWTGGGLVSNSADLANWGWYLFSGKAMSYPYLNELLKSVPISKESDEIRYAAGVAIYLKSPYGPVYGHGGWIPGYCSSLRYYPEYGISIAFQINSDVGLMNDLNPVIHKIESYLAEITIKSSATE
jgi:D-alanyl-D-alanine carboxypeptidase